MNYLTKQKIMGLIIAILSFLATLVLDGDGTILLLALPVSLLLLFTKKNLLEVEYED